MADLLDALKQRQEAILLAEFAGLLHMFGKASSDFLRAHLEGDAQDSHQDLKHLPELAPVLQDARLTEKLSFGGDYKLQGSLTDFISKYKRNKHNKRNQPDCDLLWLFNTCHQMTSADEKGVVRPQKSLSSMQIMTPFGRRAVQKVDPAAIDILREQMDGELAVELGSYLAEPQPDIATFRRKARRILRQGMSRTLGETRQPANDVTLWAQSHGVASLYKSTLANLALGEDPCPRTAQGGLNPKDIKWRLFGIGWNGVGFVQRGRKPADILRRQEILTDIQEKLAALLEIEYPLGNVFYSDINGPFFTFPGLQDGKAEELIKELAPSLAKIVGDASNCELWPFFTLSLARRTLTSIAREIEVRNRMAMLPSVAALLSLEQASGRNEVLLMAGPELDAPAPGEDVCPVCRVRSKGVDRETCPVCRDRRSGRQSGWNRRPEGQTIWVDEIADNNNRMALLTIRVDLGRWLNGEQFTTVLSQTYSDWFDGSRMQKVLEKDQQGKVTRIATPGPNPTSVISLLRHCVTDADSDPGFKAAVLDTFFEDVKIPQNQYALHLSNLRNRIDDSPGYELAAEDLGRFVFTQNASPGRLTRIWEAAQSFMEALVGNVADTVFSTRPTRLRFHIEHPVTHVEAGETYRVTIPGLERGPVVVLCEGAQQFLSVDSLEKFHGEEAVRSALRKDGIDSWFSEATGKRVAGRAEVTDVETAGPYLPFLVLAATPIVCQILLPAARVPDVLRRSLDLADDHFGVVRGKLPLHVGVLVANRRFPLYALLEAGQRIVGDPALNEGWMQSAWWTDPPTSEFYSQYPTAAPGTRGFKLADLEPVEATKQYWLNPGWFDFDFLGATTDRHRLRYDNGPPPVRPTINHGWLRPRPIPLHRLKELMEVWELLSKLGQSQLHQIEAALSCKLEEWREVPETAAPVLVRFAKAVLQDAFAGEWTTMQPQDRECLVRAAGDGLLLEAIQLFEHVLKGDLSNE